MIVIFDSSVPSQMRHWIGDAIARARPKWDFEANDDGSVTYKVVSEPSCPGHKDYMCTQTVATDSTTEIRTGADDPKAVFNQGIPGPLQGFFEESVVHELGHHRTFTHVTDDDQRTAVAALFVRNPATGEGGPRAGTLDDWNPLDQPWEDRIQEGVAEAIKDMFLPEDQRVYDNRTHWDLPAGNFDAFKDLLGLHVVPEGSFESGSPAWLSSDPLGPRIFSWDTDDLILGLTYENVTDDIEYGPNYPDIDPGDYIVKSWHEAWGAAAGAFDSGDARYPGSVIGAVEPGAKPRNPDDYEYVNLFIDVVIHSGYLADEKRPWLDIGLGDVSHFVFNGRGPGLTSKVAGSAGFDSEYTYLPAVGESLARALAKEMYDNGGKSVAHSMRQLFFQDGSPGSPVADSQGASTIKVGLTWMFSDERPVDVPYPYGPPELTGGQGPTGVMRLASGGRS